MVRRGNDKDDQSKTMFTGPLVFVEDPRPEPEGSTQEVDFEREPDDEHVEWWRAMGGPGAHRLHETHDDRNDRTHAEELVLRDRETAEARAHERRARRQRRYDGPPGPDTNVAAQNIRAEENGAIGVLDAEEWKAWLAAFDDVCPYCREESDRFIIEHVIPLSRGGENTIYNVIPACWSCNERKGRKMPWGWLPAHRLDAFVDDVLDALDRYEKRKARSD